MQFFDHVVNQAEEVSKGFNPSNKVYKGSISYYWRDNLIFTILARNFNLLQFHEKKIDICWCENYSNLNRIYLLHKTLTIYSFCHLLFPISIVLISLLFQNLIFNSKYIFKSLLKLRILNCQLKYVGVQRHNIEIEYILFGGQIMFGFCIKKLRN